MYANVIRQYAGYPTLLEAAQHRAHLTFNPHFTCGGENGTWADDPFREIVSAPAPLSPAVKAILPAVPRTYLPHDAFLEQLFNLITTQVATAWQPNAFHVHFCSSGYDSRIIAAAIMRLYQERGTAWLGQGLLFLSNRWEAGGFAALMRALDVPAHWQVALTEGPAADHFARGAYGVWRCAPCPIPGNQWDYLIAWAQQTGWLPLDAAQLQVFTGLWTNETWNAWLSPNNPWEHYYHHWYGRNVMAALPVRARWVEYPLASVPVLDSLRQLDYNSGDGLRRLLADYAIPALRTLPNPGLSDCAQQVGADLRERLQQAYARTWLAHYRDWSAPKTSSFSCAWAWWSLALLSDELRSGGTILEYPT